VQYKKQNPGKLDPANTDLLPDKPAVPCGLVAKSIFTDSFKLCKGKKADCATLNDDNTVKIYSTNIAWTSDVNFVYRNLLENTIPADACKTPPCTWENTQWLDMSD